MKEGKGISRPGFWIRISLSLFGGMCALIIQEFFPPARFLLTLSPGHLFPAIITLSWGLPWGFISAIAGQSLILAHAPDIDSVMWAMVPVFWLTIHGLWRDLGHGRNSCLYNTYLLEAVLRSVILFCLVMTGIVMNPFTSWRLFSFSIVAVAGPGAIIVREIMWAFLVLVSADILSRYTPLRPWGEIDRRMPSGTTLVIAWLCLIILIVEYLAWQMYIPDVDNFPASELRGRFLLKLFFILLAVFFGLILSWGARRRYDRLGQLENLAENIREGLLVVRRGRVLYSNREFRRIFSLTAKSVATMNRLSLEDLNGEPVDILLRRSSFKNGDLLDEYILRDPAAGIRRVRLWSHGSREGKPGRDIYLFAQDITEWRNIEDALRRSEEKFFLAFNDNPVLLCITRQSDGMFLHVNRTFESVFGYTRDEVVGKTSLGLNLWVDPLDRLALVDDISRTGSTVSREIMFRKKNGEILITETSAVGMDFDGERCIMVSLQDVTEKRLVEQELQAKELRILEIVQGIAIPTFVLDSNRRVIQWNNACESFFGVPAERILGTSDHWTCFYSEPRSMLADLIIQGAGEDEFNRLYPGTWRVSRLVEGGFEGDGFFPQYGTQGSWLFFTAAPLRDAEGRIIGAIETIQDMTERRLAEDSLRESERRYRELFVSMRDALVRLDTSRRIVQVNASAMSMFRYDDESLIGMDASEIFTIDSYPLYSEIILQVNTRGYSDLIEARLVRSDGSVFNAEIRTYIMRDENGERVGSWGIIRDLTERKRSDAILQNQHDLALTLSTITEKDRALAVLLSSAMSYEGIECGAIYEMDQETGELVINQSRGISEVYAGKVERFGRQSYMWRFFLDGSTHYWDFVEMVDTGFDYALEEGIHSAGIIPVGHRGELVSGIAVGSRTLKNIPRETRNALEALVSHVGSALARIWAEEELRIVNDRLEGRVRERTEELLNMNNRLQESLETLNSTRDQLVQAEKMAALGGLVAGVAHEINTPVGIGVTASSFLRDEGEKFRRRVSTSAPAPDELKRFGDLVVEASSSILTNLIRAAELVSSFKQVAVDQSTEERRSFFVKEYVEEVMMSLHSRIKRGRHRVEILCRDNIVIDSYPGVFAQIITNLVMNSLIHGFEGTLAGIITLEFYSRDSRLYFLYSDNGRGMDGETLKRVFDPFFTTRRGQGGTGLGLHIVFNLVTGKLGGTISVESEPDKGCLFTLSIPLTAS